MRDRHVDGKPVMGRRSLGVDLAIRISGSDAEVLSRCAREGEMTLASYVQELVTTAAASYRTEQRDRDSARKAEMAVRVAYGRRT